MSSPTRLAPPALALGLLALAACGERGYAETVTGHPNSIQPETTLSISAEGRVTRAPDIAFLQSGVRVEAKTAEQAMREAAEAMNGVFGVLEAAGVEKADMQTSNFSLQPRYDYIRPDRDNQSGTRVLAGYVVSNDLTVKVRDLDNLGKTMDALVGAGGNTFSGIRFALDDDTEALDAARRSAMTAARARADLYAEAAGYKVARIVSISESGGYSPQPMMMQARGAVAEMDTPIAGGEVGYNVTVNVLFELRK